MPGRGTKKSSCDLCCDSFEKGHEILKCEGECGCTVHRYCAGVTKKYYEELTKGSSPYVCEWCTLKTSQTVIQQLQSEVASLKLEFEKAKKALATRANVCQPPLTNTYASAAAHPPLQASSHPVIGRGRRAPRPPHSTTKRNSNANPSHAPTPANSAEGSHQQVATTNTRRRTARVRVEGARRIWNTYIHASTKSIENAISRF